MQSSSPPNGRTMDHLTVPTVMITPPDNQSNHHNGHSAHIELATNQPTNQIVNQAVNPETGDEELQLVRTATPYPYIAATMPTSCKSCLGCERCSQYRSMQEVTSIDIADAGAETAMFVRTYQKRKPRAGEIEQPEHSKQNTYLSAQLKSGFSVARFEYNDPSSLVAYFITTSITKSHSAIVKRFWSGVLAGFFIMLGATFALVASGGLDPDFRAAYPAIPKLIMGICFPVNLMMILLIGGDLMTGNCMFAVLGLFTGRIGLGSFSNLLSVSFFSNLVGILFFDYFLAYLPEIFTAEPFNSHLLSIAENKIALSWHVCFLRAVGANALVCIAIFMASTSRDALGRQILCWMPVVCFCTIGYEHLIANMVFIPTAMMYGPVSFTAEDYVVRSIIPSLIGNLVGGGFLVGGFLAYLYAKPRQSSVWNWFKYIIVPDVSFSVWFRELGDQLINDRPVKEELDQAMQVKKV